MNQFIILHEDRLKDYVWFLERTLHNLVYRVFATLAERKSRLYLALPIVNKTAQNVNDAINKRLTPLKHWVKTLTFDNGREFSWHEKLAENLDCNTYFAKPYHSWERGLNENHNGLLRQFFPKRMALDNVSEKEAFRATDLMNNRPRKCLGYKTPFEVFAKMTGKDYFLNGSVALMGWIRRLCLIFREDFTQSGLQGHIRRWLKRCFKCL